MNASVRHEPRTEAREYDVVLFGATGFVGALTAEYLAVHAPADCRWPSRAATWPNWSGCASG